jgi:hypothetical protein
MEVIPMNFFKVLIPLMLIINVSLLHAGEREFRVPLVTSKTPVKNNNKSIAISSGRKNSMKERVLRERTTNKVKPSNSSRRTLVREVNKTAVNIPKNMEKRPLTAIVSSIMAKRTLKSQSGVASGSSNVTIKKVDSAFIQDKLALQNLNVLTSYPELFENEISSGLLTEVESHWYEVRIPFGNSQLGPIPHFSNFEVFLDFSGDEADLDLFLYDINFNKIDSSQGSSSNSERVFENFDYEGTLSDTYYIEVRNFRFENLFSPYADYDIYWQGYGEAFAPVYDQTPYDNGNYEDFYEENDYVSESYDLSFDEGVWLEDILGFGVQADDDYYRIDILKDSVLYIDLLFNDFEGDIDLQLLDINRDVVKSESSVSDDEFMAVDVLAGTYFIRIYHGNSASKYNLKWETIVDEYPILTLNGEQYPILEKGSAYSLTNFSAYDYEDGDITSSVEVFIDYNDGVSNREVSFLDTYQPGVYTVTYIVKDSFGHEVLNDRIITVLDFDEVPTLILNGGSYIEIAEGQSYDDQGATAYDIEDGSLNVFTNQGGYNFSIPGTYTFTYSATDSASNNSTITRTVKVLKDSDFDNVPDNEDLSPFDPTKAKTARLVNIATRGLNGTGDKVLIGGFIISGTTPKEIIIRVRGVSLAQSRINNPLRDTFLSLYKGQTVIDSNDNWEDHDNAYDIPQHFRPLDSSESAIMTTLEPGAYTAIITSAIPGDVGTAIIEVFEREKTGISRLSNISTRGFVGTGDDVLIGGLVITGREPKKVLIRGGGPSLADHGVGGSLTDPQLTLIDQFGVEIASNNDWQSLLDFGNGFDNFEVPLSLRPKKRKEAAIAIELPAGSYTAILSGVSADTGIGIIEIFEFE